MTARDARLGKPKVGIGVSTYGVPRMQPMWTVYVVFVQDCHRVQSTRGRAVPKDLPPTLPSTPDAVATSLLPERYADLGVIATGGMGSVHRVRDLVLDRVVAMKIVQWQAFLDDPAHARFLREAQALGRLEHPGIVPLYDFGTLQDGRGWFTMRIVRGETLHTVTLRAHQATVLPLRRLVALFEQICQAVAFAHDASVLHRDLKPDNVMVGPFGEVQVLDWGLVSAIPGALPQPSPQTLGGTVLGTVAFMPPEQARGQVDGHGVWSDVYALGGILRFLLTGKAPRDPHAPVQQAAVQQVSPMPRDGLPDFLIDTIERAMAWNASERFESVAVLAGQVQDWLDGERARAQATVVLTQAQHTAGVARRLRDEADTLKVSAEAALADVPPHAPDSLKRHGWALQDRATIAESQALQHEVEFERLLQSTLRLDPTLAPAQQQLADMYRARLEHAERHSDATGAQLAEAQLRATGHHLDWLDSGAFLSLSTSPPGAQVQLNTWVVDGRRRVPTSSPTSLGTTPLNRVPLPIGRHVLVIRASGYQTARLPIRVDRAHDLSFDHVIRLPAQTDASDWIFVPPGWCDIGGDDAAPDALSKRRVWVDGFLLSRVPVTNQDYLDALNAMVQDGEDDRAQNMVPGGWRSPGAVFIRDGERYVPGSPALKLDAPVVSVSWRNAMDFADWTAQRTGLPVRLPLSMEWEKAARGTDGWLWPWGDHFDASWTVCAASFAGAPDILGVNERPTDVSPYGILGLGGNVRDWCLDLYERNGATQSGQRAKVLLPPRDDPAPRVVRGGMWAATPAQCRSASRYGAPAGQGYITVGFRLAMPWPARANSGTSDGVPIHIKARSRS
jgi:serine/threonine-protein kinase